MKDTELSREQTPQFAVKVPKDGPLGSKLFFNGQEVAFVGHINVENTMGTDDVVRSRLSIDLVGEVITVETLPD